MNSFKVCLKSHLAALLELFAAHLIADNSLKITVVVDMKSFLIVACPAVLCSY